MRKPNPWEENRIYLLKKAQEHYLSSKYFFQFIEQSYREFRSHGIAFPYIESKCDVQSGIAVWCFLPDEFIITNRIINKIILSFNQGFAHVDIWIFEDSIIKIKKIIQKEFPQLEDKIHIHSMNHKISKCFKQKS